ncbi:MAG: helix-turn-helix domain-containing protein [Desulfovibrio sp.]|uniref:helix-turn-helix domain-containing protein n=1 Tax=Desulfovibrio sp. 7SRBS1 TaxID=3378064 RepID=UPI003B3E5DCA
MQNTLPNACPQHTSIRKNITFPESSAPEITRIIPGVSLTVINFTPQKPEVITFNKTAAPLDFGYVLDGNAEVNMHPPYARPDRTERRATIGTCFITTFPEVTAEMRFPAGDHVCMAGIEVDHTLLYDEIVSENSDLPEPFIRAIRNPEKNSFWTRGTTTPQETITLRQILSCTLHGPGRGLYLQAKCLELIALRVNSLAHSQSRPVPRLCKEDIDRINLAAQILEANLDTPPGLDSLAIQIGMSVTKLKRGFKQVYGCTVYGHLRNSRMETARRLLDDGQANISQTAWRIGYTNVGHFSVAFRKYFGLKPTDYLRHSPSGRLHSNCK